MPAGIGNIVEKADNPLSIRDAFIAINAEFQRLLGPNAQMVNVGTSPNSGDGDTAPDALSKILANLKTVEAKK